MAGENAKGLTVIISPLQSLMKDQVDNLAERGITDAVTINGLLNAVERAEAIERVQNGIASMLYISQWTLNGLLAKGYRVQSARVRFVVAWRSQDDTAGQEYAIILPDIFLEK